MPEPIKIAIIYGSAREGRLCDAGADLVFSRLWEHDEIEILIADCATLWRGRGAAPGDETAALAATLDRADGFIVVTPEYNHTYPAPLKHLIDSFKIEWARKPVGFVSYGGISGGLRAVEQLRPVFSELRATTVRETVSFADVWRLIDGEGALAASGGADEAFETMRVELTWWIRALKAARSRDVQPTADAA